MLKRGGSVQSRIQNLVGEVSHLGSNLGDSLAQKLHLSPPPPPPEGDLVDLYGFPLPRNQYENYYRAKVKFDRTLEKQRKAMGPLSATLSSAHPDVTVFAGVVKNGVPEEFRPAVWPLFIEQHSSVRRTVGIYEQLLKTDKKNIAVAVSQISKDIHRTFPYYGGDSFRQKLKRVLQAYAAYNPTLGYCQAMNFLAGGLLVFCPEDVAFWMLTSIVDELLNEYFCETMTGSIADCAVLEELLSAKYPQLIEHLNSCGMPIQLIVTQWFMCLFINTLPTITAFQVWDLIFYHGATVLFEVAIAIFKMAQKGVMQLTDQVDIVYFLNDFAASIFDINKLLDEIQPLDKLEVLQLRMKHRIRIIGEAKKKDNFKLIKYVESHTKFGQKEMDELFSYFQGEGSVMDEGVRLESFLTALQIVLPQLMNTEDQHLYFDDPEPVSHRLFGLFDVNGDNVVNLRELICGISVMCKGTLEDRLRMCFKVFSDSQEMHKPHLASLLSTLYGMYYDKGFQKEISFFVDMIFMDADINSDGHLTFDEFQGAAEQQPFLMKCFRVDSAVGPQISSPKQNKPAVLSDPEEWVVM